MENEKLFYPVIMKEEQSNEQLGNLQKCSL